MRKYDFIKCMNLHKELKDRIKGHIFVTFTDDQSVSININGGRGVKYKRFINDTSVMNNIKRIADDICYDYKLFVIDKFFINKLGGIKYENNN